MTITIDRAMPVPTRTARGKAGEDRRLIVSASKLAQHLDCVRSYLAKLEAEGIIERVAGGFDLDISRTRYIRHLRRERKLSPRGEADAQLQKSKARLIELRIAEKEGELVSVESMLELIDLICGTVNSHMYQMAARIGGRDLVLRRRIDTEVRATMTDIAKAAERRALEIEIEIERTEKGDADRT